MKYTIKEVLPGQIRVEFEDETWAIVPIHPHATAEEVDDAVSKYDRDFLPDPETLLNVNISLGEERTSKALPISESKTNLNSIVSTSNTSSTDPELQQDPLPTPNRIDFGVASPLDVLVAAQYYAENGDTRLKDALYIKLQQFISDPRYSYEGLINDLLFDPDDLVEQAEAELNG
jgi:hypothetical protein